MSELNISDFHTYGIDVTKRTILIDDDENNDPPHLTGGTARRALINLEILKGLSSEPITIILNSMGGDVYSGMAIYDAIKACKNVITIKVHSAMSMASIVLQAGDERLIYENGSIMIHDGEMTLTGSPRNIKNWTEYNKKMDIIHEKIYLDKIKEKNKGFKLDELRKMLNQDTILNASKAVKLGLVDRIIKEGE